MSYFNSLRIVDTNGAAQGVLMENNTLTIRDYLQAVAEGDITNHAPWSKIGWLGAADATERDLWSYGASVATVAIPSAAATMKVRTANADDNGVSIKGDPTGDTVTSDAGGTTTTLVDADVDFLAATAVAVGDCVILDPHGTTPEWGYVTTVATNTLTCAGGFSSGGTGASRKYAVIDYSAKPGALVMMISYLDSTYAAKKELVLTAGAGPAYTTTIGTILRVNSFRVVATGANGKPTGAIALMDNAAGPTIYYTYITAGFTRARNTMYTVPLGKTLFITDVNVSYGNSANKIDYARFFLKAAQYIPEGSLTIFKTMPAAGVPIYYGVSEILTSNGSALVRLEEPIKVLATVDIKISVTASSAGMVTGVYRGWLE